MKYLCIYNYIPGKINKISNLLYTVCICSDLKRLIKVFWLTIADQSTYLVEQDIFSVAYGVTFMFLVECHPYPYIDMNKTKHELVKSLQTTCHQNNIQKTHNKLSLKKTYNKQQSETIWS